MRVLAAQKTKSQGRGTSDRVMAKEQSKYDYEANEKLCNFVRLHYRNQLSNGALQLYLLGMPYLEKRKSGFCKKVIANYDEIAQAAYKDYSGLKKLLLELQNTTLCDIQIGKPIKEDKQATEFCRYTLYELQEKRKKLLIIDEPAHAKELSEILSKRSFVYGSNSECKPFWNIAKTGRVLSNKPNVQGDSKDKRVNNLLTGLNDGQVLFDLDIKQAEPSIIQQVIKYNFDSDPYNLLAKIKNITIDEAKPEINRLAYSANSTKIVQYWPPAAKEKFMPYAQALDSYKEKLWETGKPHRPQRRFIDTLNGTRIVANRGERTHKGKILCWHIQGTVADIINSACLEIIERENFEGWKLLFPVHDSIYVVGNNQHIDDLKKIIVKKAEGMNLNLTVIRNVVGKNQ